MNQSWAVNEERSVLAYAVFNATDTGEAAHIRVEFAFC